MSGNSSNELRAQANKELVETLRRSKLFRDYERVFTEATGLPLALRPVVYWQLAHQGRKNENAFCALLAENPKTLAVCLQAHEAMVQHTGDRPHTVTCPYGLTETAVPVKLGDETIGYLRVGQVLRRALRENDVTKVRQLLKRLGLPFSSQLRNAWRKTSFLPPTRYNAIVRLLTFFAEQLSGLSNQLMLEKQNAEPPLVTRAREYIERHKTEALSLANVASAAGASVFHFCKIFHKSTGLKFSDYVARVRVEEARTKLLNPNSRISEVAYDAGFQSLTQFNRTFKRVFGKSPTGFRNGVHPSARKKAGR